MARGLKLEKEVKERNQKIYSDYKAGLSYEAMSEKYGITVKNLRNIIWQINNPVQKMKFNKKVEHPKPKKFIASQDTESKPYIRPKAEYTNRGYTTLLDEYAGN